MKVDTIRLLKNKETNQHLTVFVDENEEQCIITPSQTYKNPGQALFEIELDVHDERVIDFNRFNQWERVNITVNHEPEEQEEEA